MQDVASLREVVELGEHDAEDGLRQSEAVAEGTQQVQLAERDQLVVQRRPEHVPQDFEALGILVAQAVIRPGGVEHVLLQARQALDDLLLRGRPVGTVHERLQHQDLPDLVLEGTVELQNGRDSLPVGELLDIPQNDVPGLVLVGLREILREAVHDALQGQLRHLLDRVRDLHGWLRGLGLGGRWRPTGWGGYRSRPGVFGCEDVRVGGESQGRVGGKHRGGRLGERWESSRHYRMSCVVDIPIVIYLCSEFFGRFRRQCLWNLGTVFSGPTTGEMAGSCSRGIARAAWSGVARNPTAVVPADPDHRSREQRNRLGHRRGVLLSSLKNAGLRRSEPTLPGQESTAEKALGPDWE